MKKALIVIGILIAVIVIGISAVSSLMPQKFTDFIFGFASASFKLDSNDSDTQINLELGEGVTVDDRVFVFKKFLVATVIKDVEPDKEELAVDYVNALVLAGEDDVLSAVEVEQLRELHSDVLTEENVNNFIEWVEEYDDDGKFEEMKEYDNDRSDK
jgi:hypothetical protein